MLRTVFTSRAAWLGLPVAVFLAWAWLASYRTGFLFTFRHGDRGVMIGVGQPGAVEAGVRLGAGWRVNAGPQWHQWRMSPDTEPAGWLPVNLTVKPLGHYSWRLPYWLLLASWLVVWSAVVIYRSRRRSQLRM